MAKTSSCSEGVFVSKKTNAPTKFKVFWVRSASLDTRICQRSGYFARSLFPSGAQHIGIRFLLKVSPRETSTAWCSLCFRRVGLRHLDLFCYLEDVSPLKWKLLQFLRWLESCRYLTNSRRLEVGWWRLLVPPIGKVVDCANRVKLSMLSNWHLS